MWRAALVIVLGATLAGSSLAHPVFAQHPSGPGSSPHGHDAMPGQGATMHAPPGAPTMSGQDAFAAIAEIVAILDADPSTDWTKIDLERLRQHLIDMNEVVLHAAVTPSPAPGGLVMDVTGPGRTEQAIRAMVIPHAAELDRMADWSARTEMISGGVRLTVISRLPDDPRAVARIRGLGFAGLITVGAHHQPHHLAMARGESLAGHR
jgi:hypothetical protein